MLVEGELDELKDVFVFDGGRHTVYAECNILESWIDRWSQLVTTTTWIDLRHLYLRHGRIHDDAKRTLSPSEAKHSLDGRTSGDSNTRNDCENTSHKLWLNDTNKVFWLHIPFPYCLDRNLANKSHHLAEISGKIIRYGALAPCPEVLLSWYFNTPFAGSGHTVRNKLRWDANNAVRLSNQRKVELDW